MLKCENGKVTAVYLLHHETLSLWLQNQQVNKKKLHVYHLVTVLVFILKHSFILIISIL